MRVFFNSLRCFFFAIRLRRFLITEPTVYLSGVALLVGPLGTPKNRASSALPRPHEPTCSGPAPRTPPKDGPRICIFMRFFGSLRLGRRDEGCSPDRRRPFLKIIPRKLGHIRQTLTTFRDMSCTLRYSPPHSETVRSGIRTA